MQADLEEETCREERCGRRGEQAAGCEEVEEEEEEVGRWGRWMGELEL